MGPSSEDRFTLNVSEEYALSVFRRPVYSWRFGTVCSVRLQKTGLLLAFQNSMLCPSSEDGFTLDVSEQYALSVIRRPVYSRRFKTVCSVRLQKTGLLSTFRNSMLCPSSEDQFTLDIWEQYSLSRVRHQKTSLLLTFRNSMLCPS